MQPLNFPPSHPFGIHQLFGMDMSLLTNTSMPLNEMIGEEKSNALITKLNEAAQNENRINVLNEFFTSQLPAIEIPAKIKQALNYIDKNKGNVSVKDIEANCFITSRSLERHFKTSVGQPLS